MKKTWVQYLVWEDLLQEGMETHFPILAWIIPWMEESDGLQAMESQGVAHDWAHKTHTSLSTIHYKGVYGVEVPQVYTSGFCRYF